MGFQQRWADGCARVLEQPLAADGVPVRFSYPRSSYPRSYVSDGRYFRAGLGSPDQCTPDLARPDVPLPVFPSGTEQLSATPPAIPGPGD